jgi:hypothetical protein
MKDGGAEGRWIAYVQDTPSSHLFAPRCRHIIGLKACCRPPLAAKEIISLLAHRPREDLHCQQAPTPRIQNPALRTGYSRLQSSLQEIHLYRPSPHERFCGAWRVQGPVPSTAQATTYILRHSPHKQRFLQAEPLGVGLKPCIHHFSAYAGLQPFNPVTSSPCKGSTVGYHSARLLPSYRCHTLLVRTYHGCPRRSPLWPWSSGSTILTLPMPLATLLYQY